jgi:hypothetical protein
MLGNNSIGDVPIAGTIKNKGRVFSDLILKRNINYEAITSSLTILRKVRRWIKAEKPTSNWSKGTKPSSNWTRTEKPDY